MQDQVRLIIGKVRDQINIYLASRPHYVSEGQLQYIYVDDLSGRLTALEAICGRFQSSINDQTDFYNLWELATDDAEVEADDLAVLIDELKSLLSPIQGFPPIKSNLKQLILKAIIELTKAKLLIEPKSTQEEMLVPDQKAVVSIVTQNSNSIWSCIPQKELSQKATSAAVTIMVKTPTV